MVYRFSDVELRADTRELLVGGKAIAVEPQVFDLLLALIAARHRVMSRDELIELVWRGINVSDSAISARISAARAAIGDDGRRQAMIATIPRRGFRFVAELEGSGPRASPSLAARQQVALCRSADGTGIAYARSGSGPPLVRTGHWLTHLEFDWVSPLWRPYLDRLGRRFEVIRYDQRGTGLSDWSIDQLTLERLVDDLEAVVDAAALERFVLYGSSQGAPVAVAFAARHPQRVSRLILQGGFERGRLVSPDPAERERAAAMLTLIRTGWGMAGSAFIDAFATLFIPDGSREQVDSLAELQRRTTSADNAARLREMVDRIDVSSTLAELRCPTLVIHSTHDSVQPLERGRQLASGIAGAQFLQLDSRNHVIVPQETAWSQLFEAIDSFAGAPD